MTGKEGVDEVFDVVGPTSEDGERTSIVLRVHVNPGAGRTAVVGRHGDAVKLRVAAPPEGGRANEAVADLLATTLGVDRDRVTLASGQTSRSKRFRVEEVDLDAVRRLLKEAMAGETGGNARGRRGVR
jgi:uncharacterized protein (TIGR00251 family)